MNRTALALIAAIVLFSTGCSKSKPAESQSAGTKGPGDLKIALILPGPINDQSWNAINYAGLQKCNASLGTKMEYIENVQAPDYESTFRNYAERGYDLIMAAGTQFDEAANRVAENYPKSVFCVVNGMVSQGANVAPIFPREYEASYVAALIAGQVSPSGQFATIGGFPNNAMEKLLDVYEQVSVETAKGRGLENARAVRAYANSWDDVSLGKQMAETMINNGADTLFVYANQVGLGSIQAAKEKGITFIGFSGDQTVIDPDTVVASVVFDFETFYVWAVKAFIEGNLQGNTVHEAGIKENIFVPVYTASVPQAVRDNVAAGIDRAIKGEVNLTSYFAKP